MKIKEGEEPLQKTWERKFQSKDKYKSLEAGWILAGSETTKGPGVAKNPLTFSRIQTIRWRWGWQSWPQAGIQFFLYWKP